MKTLMINASPKKKLSVSSHFLLLQRLFIRGSVTRDTLRTNADHKRILEKLGDVDNVVFVLPLYVDGVPSHVLYFMKAMERYCREKNIHINIYVLSNGGFIEGNQNRVLMEIFENFCTRCGFVWGGGIGVGGGVMLNVMRILFFVYIGLFLLGILTGSPLSTELGILAREEGIVLFFHLGVLFYSIGMGNAISKGKSFGVKFTRALMPSFLFIIVADIFFVLISIFKGGIFRGWLSRKEP